MQTRAKYTDTQMSELNRIGEQIGAAVGIERHRLSKVLKRTKYLYRKESWKEYIRTVIREKSHFRLAKAMTRNGTIHHRREAKQKVVDNRKKTVKMWSDYLTDLYSAKHVPDFPIDHPIHSINIDDLLQTAEDLVFTEEDIRLAFKRAKTGRAVGLNNISTELIRH